MQRRAISSIEPSFEALEISIGDGMFVRRNLSCALYKPFKQTFFPNIKTIIVGKLAFKYVQQETSQGLGMHLSEDGWKEWVIQMLRQRERDDIQVEFKDPDPSW